jgi:GT2 family glycosyltransferase
MERLRDRITVVIATRDRVRSLLRTLTHLDGSCPDAKVVVVDNGSSDDTAAVVAQHHPKVKVIRVESNLGPAARNVGVEVVSTPYVAFCDDDSWWARGALERAVEILDEEPLLALIMAKVLVGSEERIDPTCAAMAQSPLAGTAPNLPGIPILGFLACGAVARVDAFRSVGGFYSRFSIGGEEALLALDLVTEGWRLAYVDEIVVHHHPSPGRDNGFRKRTTARNDLWSAWLRRRVGGAVDVTARAALEALGDASVRQGFWDAVRELPSILGDRRPIPRYLERDLRSLSR